jgi:hypothetical protein
MEQQGGPPLGAGDGLALTTCLQSALWRTWRQNSGLCLRLDHGVKFLFDFDVKPANRRLCRGATRKTNPAWSGKTADGLATGSSFRYPSLFKKSELLTIFVARTRYRHLRVQDLTSGGGNIILFF